MKLLDRLFQIPPEKAVPDTFDYEMYRFGAVATFIGVVVTAGSIVARAMGLEVGTDVSLGGDALLAIGGVALAGGVETLKQE